MYLGCQTLIFTRTLFSLSSLSLLSNCLTEKECVSESIYRVVVLMRLRRMIGSTGTFCSSLLCNNNTAFLGSRRSSKSSAMLFPIASKSSSTGGEFSSFVFHGRRRFKGQERGRFGGGLFEENTTKYNTTTHLQKHGFTVASTHGIQNNNEQLKLFSVSSSLL